MPSLEYLQGVYAGMQGDVLKDPIARLENSRNGFFAVMISYNNWPTMARRGRADEARITYTGLMSELMDRVLLELLPPADRAMHLAACLVDDETVRTRFHADLTNTEQSEPPKNLSPLHHDLTDRITSEGENAHEHLIGTFGIVVRDYFLSLESHIHEQPRAVALGIGRRLLKGLVSKGSAIKTSFSPGAWPMEQ